METEDLCATYETPTRSSMQWAGTNTRSAWRTD